MRHRDAWCLTVVAGVAVGGACHGAPVRMPREVVLESIVAWLEEGRIEQVAEELARLRARDPRDFEVAQWSSVTDELLWRDDDAIVEQLAAIRGARNAGVDAATDAILRGRLGDLLFQAGRWGESTVPLEVGAVGADAERRRAFAAVSRLLPFTRNQTGPLLTEQPLLGGGRPEFVCSAADMQRPFAIDTGTSMTTLSRSLAAELDVRNAKSAGLAIDSTGRSLAVDIGLLPRFAVGEVAVGNVPVLVVDDAALLLRDLHGGPERAPSGVLGLDLLSAFRMTIDPERDSVVLEYPRGLPERESVQCVRANGRCLVPVIIDGIRFWFVLDTGASHSSLTPEGADGLPPGRQAEPAFRRVRTVGGSLISVREVRDLVLRVSDARFRGVALPVVPRQPSGAFPVHGVIGMDLLGRCRVTLDRGRARVLAFE